MILIVDGVIKVETVCREEIISAMLNNDTEKCIVTIPDELLSSRSNDIIKLNEYLVMKGYPELNTYDKQIEDSSYGDDEDDNDYYSEDDEYYEHEYSNYSLAVEFPADVGKYYPLVHAILGVIRDNLEISWSFFYIAANLFSKKAFTVAYCKNKPDCTGIREFLTEYVDPRCIKGQLYLLKKHLKFFGHAALGKVILRSMWGTPQLTPELEKNFRLRLEIHPDIMSVNMFMGNFYQIPRKQYEGTTYTWWWLPDEFLDKKAYAISFKEIGNVD